VGAVDGQKLTRRGSLLGLGGFLLAALGWRSTAADAGPAGVASGAVACVLTPEQTEGPYYIAGEKLRRNITEGRPGVPLLLRLRVVDASTCRPIKGAAVDIWHADALGVYSGFGAGRRNRTAMRGVQRTDRTGLARFRSVYPGWYQGRTVHIHVKVHVAGNVVHTGQLYFPDSVTDRVFRRKPYSRRPRRTTRNANDFVFAQGAALVASPAEGRQCLRRQHHARRYQVGVSAPREREAEAREPLLPQDGTLRQALLRSPLAGADDDEARRRARPARQAQRPRQEDGRQVEPVRC
jgi:protocatechuate 3,4-dioxygenase beta subunit